MGLEEAGPGHAVSVDQVDRDTKERAPHARDGRHLAVHPAPARVNDWHGRQQGVAKVLSDVQEAAVGGRLDAAPHAGHIVAQVGQGS